MNTPKTYIWKYFEAQDFKNAPKNNLKIFTIKSFKELLPDNPDFLSEFIEMYDQVKIPQTIVELFNKLFIFEGSRRNKSQFYEYELNEYSEEFLLLSCASQEKISLHWFITDPNDKLHESFLHATDDYNNLLSILESFLKNPNKNSIIVIDYYSNPFAQFKSENFFVTSEILSSLCEKYNLNLENFEKRKEEILTLTYHLEEWNNIKKTVAKNLFNFLQQKGLSQADSKRFIGAFLIISQIPIDSKKKKMDFNDVDFKEIIDLGDINAIIDSVDEKVIANYINR